MQKDVNVYTGDNIRSIELKAIKDSNMFEAKVVVEHDDILTTYEIPYIQLNDNCSVGINKKKKETGGTFRKGNLYRYYECDAKLNINISGSMLDGASSKNDSSYGTKTDDYSKLLKVHENKDAIKKSNITI